MAHTAGLILVGCAFAARAAAAFPTPAAEMAPVVQNPTAPSLGDDLRETREQLEAARAQLQQLTQGNDAPPWAITMQQEVRRDLERVIEMEERLAARIETPLPRLDEPLVLFTVAASTLVLGFVLGGSVQRRRSRRDGRLRL
jgi:hypothetical protein